MSIWTTIGNFFKALLNAFKGFVNQAFTDGSKIIIAELKEFAVAVVADLSIADITNSTKRKEALKRIQEEAKKSGKDLSDSLGSFIVELAYQYFQNNKDTLPVPVKPEVSTNPEVTT